MRALGTIVTAPDVAISSRFTFLFAFKSHPSLSFYSFCSLFLTVICARKHALKQMKTEKNQTKTIRTTVKTERMRERESEKRKGHCDCTDTKKKTMKTMGMSIIWLGEDV